MDRTVTIQGVSGTEYQFTKHDFIDTFYQLPAVYIYVSSKCELIPDFSHPFIYIGETDNLHKRMAAHIAKNDKGEHVCAMNNNGADYLLVHYAPNPFPAQGIKFHTAKDYVEAVQNDLLHLYDTPCNTQHNTWADKKSS